VTLGLPTVADWKNDHLAQLAPPETKVLTLQFSILRIPAIWVLAASSATVYVTRYAIASWGILYLQEARGYGLADASLFMAMGTIAGIAGCLLYGYASDRYFVARRPPTNLVFAIAELAGLYLIFFGATDSLTLTAGFILFGIGLNGLVTSLGGLFAIDIAPKKVAGAAMGFIGVFSYLGAAIQENISGALIESGMQVAGDVRTYDFGPAVSFWIGSSIVSMLLAATLWRVRLRE
jgi:OPA family sugar phosphate sensor protein UhpC-like MFS transporter